MSLSKNLMLLASAWLMVHQMIPHDHDAALNGKATITNQAELNGYQLLKQALIQGEVGCQLHDIQSQVKVPGIPPLLASGLFVDSDQYEPEIFVSYSCQNSTLQECQALGTISQERGPPLS